MLKNGISRREFARGGALLASAALLKRAEGAPKKPLAAPATPPAPKLSPAGQAEAEARLAAILRKHGAHLGKAERADLRRQVLDQQRRLEALRAFPLENSDEPAHVFRP